jgi:hypothetical protein
MVSPPFSSFVIDVVYVVARRLTRAIKVAFSRRVHCIIVGPTEPLGEIAGMHAK